MLTTAAYYLGSRAMITRPIWSLYPPRLAAFMDCPSCSGFWYGLIVGAIGCGGLGLPFLGLDTLQLYTPLAVALCSMVWTPVLAAIQHTAFERLGSAVMGPDDDGPAA